MSCFGDLAVVLCIWAWACAIASLMARRGWVHIHAVGQLIGLTIVAALGWIVCLLGFLPATDTTQPLEMLAMHPALGPVVWLGGFAQLTIAVYRHLQRRERIVLLLRQSGSKSFLVLALGLSCAWSWTLGPPLRIDEGLYHLSLPLQYIRSGSYVAVPGHGNSGFFALGDMLFWWCMNAGAPGAARQMQLLVMIVGWAALVAQTTPCRRARLSWAWATWLCSPIVFWDVSCAYVDVIEAVLSLCGLSCLARWYDCRKLDQNMHLAQAAWLLGAAAACRQLALVSLPALGLVVLWRLRAQAQADTHSGQKNPSMWGVAGAFGLCCALPLMFVVHNMWIFGNPVYPFAARFFSGAAQLRSSQLSVLAQFLQQHGPMHMGTPRTGFDALWHLPWALFMDAAFGSPKFDGVVGPLPLIALAVGICRLCCRHNGFVYPAAARLEGRLYLAFAGLRGAIWLSTSWQARFLIMPLGAISLWLSYAWPQCARRDGPWVHFERTMRLAAAATMLFAFIKGLHGQMPLWDRRYLGSPMARHQARLEQLPESRLGLLAARQARPGRTMLVWTQRLAIFCPSALWSDSYDEAATWVAWLEDLDGPSPLARLHQAKIAHLLVDEQAFLSIPASIDAAERSRWQKVLKRWQIVARRDLRLIDEQGSVRLYAVGEL